MILDYGYDHRLGYDSLVMMRNKKKEEVGNVGPVFVTRNGNLHRTAHLLEFIVL
jgi:hypothetical protein